MKDLFEKEWNDTKEQFIKKCFDTIADCCSLVPHGELHTNSRDYICMQKNSTGNYVPYVSFNGGLVEMYSEDGWNSIDDLAHWANVAVDVVKSIVAGCGERYDYQKVEIKVKGEQ